MPRLRARGVARCAVPKCRRLFTHFRQYDPAARVGSIGGLDVCDIKIVEGSETDFVVTNGEAPWVLRAMDDQDRRNWVLEIIKQRPIRSIIEMLHDDKVLCCDERVKLTCFEPLSRDVRMCVYMCDRLVHMPRTHWLISAEVQTSSRCVRHVVLYM